MPDPHLLLHVGNSNGGVQLHDQLVHAAAPRVTQPVHARTRKNNALTHTQRDRRRLTHRWHRVMRKVRESDLPDVSGNFRSMIYMGITSTDPSNPPKGELEVLIDLFCSTHLLQPILASVSFSSLSLGFIFQERTFTHSLTHYNYLYYRLILYHIQPIYIHHPQRITAEFKMTHRTLARRNWSSVRSTGGEIPYLYYTALWWHIVKWGGSEVKWSSSSLWSSPSSFLRAEPVASSVRAAFRSDPV